MNGLELVLLGAFVVTSYQPIPSQTDDSPTITSIGVKVWDNGIAVHPSLLCPNAKKSEKPVRLCRRKSCIYPNKVHYLDRVYVEGIGTKVVNDVMAENTAMGSRWDILVRTREAEADHHRKFGTNKIRVWRIKG